MVGIFLSEDACQEAQEAASGGGAAPIASASTSTTTSASGPARANPAALLGEGPTGVVPFQPRGPSDAGRPPRGPSGFT
ncbi:hypothetical protein DL770_010252 [Monosporascus sp. CRB-9-2]|nr:hypothetical protein DL770_010252 [Monosporascus sp. CRB-9-2]